MQKNRTGLRSEILITLAILLGSALLLGGFLFLRYVEQNLLQQRTQTATQGMRLIATSLAEKNLAQNSTRPDILFHLHNQLNAQSWWVFDRDLNLQFSYLASPTESAPEKNEVPRRILRQIQLDNNEVVELTWPGLLPFLSTDKTSSLLVAIPLKTAGRSQGVLVASFSLADLANQLNSAQRWLIFYVFAFGAVLVTAGLYLLNRNIVRPTHKLLEATQDIADGNFSLRLENSGPREIHALASSFNHMVAALEASQRETEQHIQSLSATNLELQQTQKELVRSEKLATVGYLAAGMAHEIGNPLGALTGYLALLQKEANSELNSEILEQASAAADRIDRIVRELLDYSTPSRTMSEPQDPWIAVKDAVRLLEVQGSFKDFRLIMDQDLHLPALNIDQHKLGQVIVNLLLNSLDACQPGGEISVSGEEADGEVQISITDTGCGIPSEQLATIFEPFFTTKPPGKGRGLGLAVCQRIVAEAHGKLSCESSPGEGSTFRLSFPSSRQPADQTMQNLHN